jgi:hypothetical protein
MIRMAILHEQFPAFDVVEQALMQRVEVARVDRPVDLAPPDSIRARGFLDDELVVGRTPGVLACSADQGSFSRDQGLASAHRFFVQRGDAEIPVNASDVSNAVKLEPARLLRVCHPLLACRVLYGRFKGAIVLIGQAGVNSDNTSQISNVRSQILSDLRVQISDSTVDCQTESEL